MGISSFGTLLKRGNAATPEVFVAIAEVGDITGPALKLNTEDGTTHGSPGGWKEKIPTTLEGGQISFPVQFVPSDATQSYAAGLIKDMVNRTKRNFQMVFPDTTTWSFAAFVTQFTPKAPVEGKLSADVTLDITGQPTLA